MEETLKILNQLEREGVLSEYAIGGAMAAMFYAEPVSTFDLDVFMLLPEQRGILTLTPLYETLHAMGFKEHGECVMIEGVPVQFLPAYNALLEDALKQAIETQYESTPTRVMRAEHLIAICLQTGRTKDRERVRLLREEAAIDDDMLRSIVQKHGLEERWRQWNP
ncbi:hypothetical protein JXA32_12260 [Candidatus Sumerlaeota bacterium]|nr:hypothetical protein [Candidatus Sumerlaeota bacterium]